MSGALVTLLLLAAGLEGSVAGKETSAADSLPVHAAPESQQSLLGGSQKSLSDDSQQAVWGRQAEVGRRNHSDKGGVAALERQGLGREGREWQEVGWEGQELGRGMLKVLNGRKERKGKEMEGREGREEREEQELGREKREEGGKGQEYREAGQELGREVSGLRKGRDGRDGRDGSITLGTLNPDENLSVTIGLDSMFNAGTSLLSSLLVVAAVLGVVGIGAGVIAAVAAGWKHHDKEYIEDFSSYPSSSASSSSSYSASSTSFLPAAANTLPYGHHEDAYTSYRRLEEAQKKYGE